MSLSAYAESIAGKVTRVGDGDTVWVTDAAKLRHKVRLDRIDKTPEHAEAEAEARLFWFIC